MSLLKNRNYMLLRIGWGISSLGSQMQSFAFSLYVLYVTGSAVQFSITLCMEMLPMIIFAPISGYTSDRFDRKKQVILYDVLSATAVALVLVLYIIQGSLEVYQIYLCVFVLSSFQTFSNSVASCLIQAAVNPEDYTKQKSVDSTISSLISLFSPAIAGMLYGFLGIGILLLLNAISFLFSAIMELFLNMPKRQKSSDVSFDNSLLRSILDGFQYIRKSPFIISFLLILSMLNFILPGVTIGLMAVSQKLMHLNSVTIGFESSALSIGIMAGAVLCGLLDKKFEKMALSHIILGSIATDAAVFVLLSIWLLLFYGHISLVFNVIVFVILNLAILFGNSILSVNFCAQFQRQIPNEIMGRTTASVNAVLTVCAPLGQIFAGFLMSGLPYYAAYLVEGVLCVILCGYCFKNAKKSAIIINK